MAATGMMVQMAMGMPGKISLPTDVVGQLSAENLGDHHHNGVQISKINPISEIAGVAEGAFLFHFNNDEFTVPQTISVLWKSEAGTADNSKIVRLTFPEFSAESAALSMGNTLVSVELPEELRPIDDIYIPVMVRSNGNIATGGIHIFATGQIEFQINDDYIGFSTTGLKGFPAFVIQYPVYPKVPQ
jgi:hypothetical protein